MPTPEERDIFSRKISTICLRESVTVMEAIMDQCEKTGLEVEVAATLLNSDLKDKLEKEARTLHCLKGGKRRK
jgi:Phage late-transcription coactivator